MSYNVTRDDVKSYCVITGTRYDSQINAIVYFWQNALDAMIDTAYTDGTYDAILTMGKLMVISGHVGAQLPAEATRQNIKSKKLGDYQLTLQDASKGPSGASGSQALIDQGLAMLAPYLKADATPYASCQIASSTVNYEREFTLERKSADGTVIETGSMEDW